MMAIRRITESEIRDYLRDHNGSTMEDVMNHFSALEGVVRWDDKERLRGMLYRRLRSIAKYPGAKRTMIDGRWFYELTE